jgi:nitrogen regulatory protein P-II 1
MKMVWAVVRSSHVKEIAAALKELGISGCTVYPVRGYGEEWHVYEPLVHGGHHKVEVIIENDLAERVITEINERAWTGLAGDGVLAVFELDKVVHLRSKKALT